MIPLVTFAHIRWQGVAGATGYELRVNGAKVSTAGPNARSSKFAVGEKTFIEIIDLPARSLEQRIDFAQVTG